MTRRAITTADRGKAVAAVFGGATGTLLAMRAPGGEQLTADRRTELLAAAVARQDVELEVDILAYEQEPGKANLRFFRFTAGAMRPLAKSGIGTPFLRDHDAWNVQAIGGTVTASRVEQVGDGHYKLLQTVSLREPAAVERALRGLMGAVSIGARPTGSVLCSACDAEVLEACWHWPGEVIKATAEGEADQVVEWVYTSAVLKETSEVPIGAVPTAGVQTIRAAFEALGGEAAPNQQRSPMSAFRTALTAALALAATAGDDEILAAVHQRQRDAETDRADLAVARRELSSLRQVSAADTFIAQGMKEGKIAAGDDEKLWRDLHAANPDRAKLRLSERAPGSATPVGQPLQSTAPATPAATPPGGAAAAAGAQPVDVDAGLRQQGYDPGVVRDQLAQLGSKDPKKSLEAAARREGGR